MRSIVNKFLIAVPLNILLFFTPINLYASFNPFYVSVTEMNYNSQTRSLEISCKMFAEDIEDVLEQNYKKSIDLGNDKLLAQNNTLIKDYVSKHFALNIDSKQAILKFVGFEKDKESIYCYLEVTDIPAFKKVTVNSTVLYDFKQEQINIVHVVVNGNRKSSKLDYPQNTANFNF